MAGWRRRITDVLQKYRASHDGTPGLRLLAFGKPIWSAMRYEIAVGTGYLRATLLERETVAHTREFFHAAILENATYRCSSVLLDVRSSRPMFNVGQHGLIAYFKELVGGAPGKIALLGDTPELRISHDYIALLARQQGINVQSFRDRAAALLWLGERRQQQAQRRTLDQRRTPDRQYYYAERRRDADRRRIPDRRHH